MDGDDAPLPHDPTFVLVTPLNQWPVVLDQLCACRAVVSSSLHGLVCADAYGRPNVWLNEHPLPEGELKFHDYFESQGRTPTQLRSLAEYDPERIYAEGNRVDLDALVAAFPFA